MMAWFRGFCPPAFIHPFNVVSIATWGMRGLASVIRNRPPDSRFLALPLVLVRISHTYITHVARPHAMSHPSPVIYHLEEGYKQTRSTDSTTVEMDPRRIKSESPYHPGFTPYEPEANESETSSDIERRSIQTEFFIMTWHQIVKCEPTRWARYVRGRIVPENCPAWVISSTVCARAKPPYDFHALFLAKRYYRIQIRD